MWTTRVTLSKIGFLPQQLRGRHCSDAMIISHKHKFIFIKTEKTAGTSMEIALSRFCGPEDILTRISKNDELLRQQSDYRRPQNFLIPLRRYSQQDIVSVICRRKRLSFYNHCTAAFIRSHIDPDAWDTYYKFCFERNPWDKVISLYYWWHGREPRPTISEFIQSGAPNRIAGFDLYTIFGEIVVDQVFLYEQLDQAVDEICRRLGLPEPLTLPHAKAGHRENRRPYQEILSKADRKKIEKVFAREIAHFGYAW